MSEIETRKNNLSDILQNLIKNHYKLILIAILIFAFILRLKYNNINTAVWWDESEYLATAKHWVFNTPYEIAKQRQPLYPLILAGLYSLGIKSLATLRFFANLIPSTLIILFTYLLGKELYNKQVALIASFIMSVFWVLLFNTARFHTDIFALLFALIAFYLFWTGFEKKQSKIRIYLMGLFIGLGFITRVGGILAVASILTYILITKKHKTFININLYISLLITFLTILPYLIWNYLYHKNILAFFGGYFGAERAAMKLASPIPWFILNFFKEYTEWIFFIIFLIGLITLFDLIIGFDLILKNKENKLRADLFILIPIIITYIFFLFIERNSGTESRWLLIMAPSVYYIVGKGFALIYKYLSKINKHIAIIIILFILIAGAKPHLTKADMIIKVKADSYGPLRDVGLWIKENSNENDTVFNSGVPQNSFWSERFTYNYPNTPEEFEDLLLKVKAKYIVISLFEIEGDWLSIEQFDNTGLRRWALPYFNSELIIENGQPTALFNNQPAESFPPPKIEKDKFTFNLVKIFNGAFIYQVNYK